MPDSLKWLAALLVGAILAAPASLYVQRLETEHRGRIIAAQLTGGDPDAGRAAVSRYGCPSCHQFSGARGVAGQVGPSLTGMASRPVIAARLPNDPSDLIRWVRFPQEVSPGCGMPDLAVNERDGRDIAAYLYTLQ